jgi:putative membrane protein
MSHHQRIFVSMIAGLALAAPVWSAESPAEQIAFVSAIDEHEIAAAQEAKNRNVPQPVQQFAEMMIEQHQQNLDETQAVSEKLGVAPAETAQIAAFKTEGESKLGAMRSLDDQAFAKKYADEMVAGHEKALKKIDGFMKNAEGTLKEHLAKTRSHVATHLMHAKQLRASLA